MNHQNTKHAKEPDAHLDGLARRVIGAAIEVHKALGPGFLETISEEAPACELDDRGIPYERQAPVRVIYKGKAIGDGRLDFLVDRARVVELKTVEKLAPIHTAQLLSYLKATNYRLGLLINFNVPILNHGIKRLVL